MSKSDNTLPLLIGAGAIALLLGRKSSGMPKVNLTGDDARDALAILKQMGAPPDLLAYLATKPTLLKEAMQKGTINGKPLPAAPKSGDGGGGGGGSGGGGGGGKPRGGGAGPMSGRDGGDLVGAALALVKGIYDGLKAVGGWLFGSTAPADLQSGSGNLSLNDYQSQLMAQVQSGNLTQEQADSLMLYAQESGDTSARSIGDEVYAQVLALRDEGSITDEQFENIMAGTQTAYDAQLQNAWSEIDRLTVEEGGTPFNWDDFVIDPATGLPETEPYSGGIDWPEVGEEAGWPENEEGDLPIDLPDLTNEDGDYTDWELDWMDEFPEFIFEEGGNDDFWNDYDSGMFDADLGWTQEGYSSDYDYDFGYDYDY